MAKTLLLSIALLAAAFLLLGIKVLFIKGSRFPSGHIHSSPQLKSRGISCQAHKTTNKKQQTKIHDYKA